MVTARLHREPALDIVRGWAALTVVIAHTTIAGLYNVQPWWGLLKWTPLRLLWSGHQAVILFFVISGFALTLMLSARPLSYPTYLRARLWRLYPPYLASVLLALAGYQLLQVLGVQWQAGWLNTIKPTWHASALLQHVLMVGVFDTNQLNPPLWSIIHEMRISIIFPLILWLVTRYGARALSGAITMPLTIAAIWFLWPSLQTGWVGSFTLSLHYASFFIIGAYLALNREYFRTIFQKQSSRTRTLLWLTGLALYAYPFDNPWSLPARAVGDLAISGGATLILLLALSQKLPCEKLGNALGKISYSLYLNHMLVLNVILILGYAWLPFPFIWLAAIGGSLVLATFMFFCIEKPSIGIGRQQ